jgi:hypothetical protein
MSKTDLIAIIRKLLQTDRDLDFLLKLDEDELKLLVASIREAVGQKRLP